MTDDLDAVRAPVRVGTPAPPGIVGHPTIDGRTTVAVRGPIDDPGRRPPDPLGLLGDDDRPVSGTRRRPLVALAAAAVVLLAVAAIVTLARRGRDAPTAVLAPGSTTASTTPSVSRSVTFTATRSAQDQPACSAAACRFVDVTLHGFEPGAEVTVTCHGEQQGAFGASPVTIGADGSATQEAWYFGYAGERVWVDADGITSPTLVWPPG